MIRVFESTQDREPWKIDPLLNPDLRYNTLDEVQDILTRIFHNDMFGFVYYHPMWDKVAVTIRVKNIECIIFDMPATE